MKMRGGELKFWGIFSAVIAAVIVFMLVRFQVI
jgi:hypothetical protein